MNTKNLLKTLTHNTNEEYQRELGEKMVGPEGFEPSTCRSGAGRHRLARPRARMISGCNNFKFPIDNNILEVYKVFPMVLLLGVSGVYL